jgi:hypothetical protein
MMRNSNTMEDYYAAIELYLTSETPCITPSGNLNVLKRAWKKSIIKKANLSSVPVIIG